jgi:hypothetical protein
VVENAKQLFDMTGFSVEDMDYSNNHTFFNNIHNWDKGIWNNCKLPYSHLDMVKRREIRDKLKEKAGQALNVRTRSVATQNSQSSNQESPSNS